MADSSTPVNGGTLMAAMPDNPDHLDPGLSYTNEGWEMLETTNNGLLTFKKAAGAEGNLIVPDIAAAMPKVSDGGKTYTFKVRTGVMFSAPVSRQVEPSDFKFSIERLFRIDSGGVGFYTGIVGANQYAKTRKGGISGIVANDAAHTITFHLTVPDGTFLDYMAVPFAFVLPKGTPDKDISTLPKSRIATGPYEISGYTPKDSIVITRNPTFKSWTKDTPDGHLDGVHVALGVTPDQAVDETANGQLDWYFEPVAPDRLTELKARYPKQVFDFTRNNVTYFTMNSRKAPFDKLAVRQAVNYAIDRRALVKLFGGQGTPTENILPPGMGSAYKKHGFYPYDLAKAKALVASSGTKGMAVTVWSHTTDPTPKAAQYMASVLAELGLQDERQDARRVGLLGHDRDPEGRPADRIPGLEPGLPGGPGLHRHPAQRQEHHERRQQQPVEHERAGVQQADRRRQADAARPRAQREVGGDRLPGDEDERAVGAVHEPPDPEVRVAARARARLQHHLLRAAALDVAGEVARGGRR